MFCKFGVVLLKGYFVWNDCGETLILKVSSGMILLGVIFSVDHQYYQSHRIVIFVGSKDKNKSLHHAPRESKLCTVVAAD